MKQLDWERPQPACMLAHDLVNKLSVIIGHCDLLGAKAEPGTECVKRPTAIHDTAKSMATELTNHQCKLSAVIRSTDQQGDYASR